MGKISEVEISGHRYRYQYDDGATKYRGPVGSGPALSEEEFIKAISDTEQIFSEDEIGRYVFDVGEFLTRWNNINAEQRRDALEMELDEEVKRKRKLWFQKMQPIYKEIFDRVADDDNWKSSTKPVVVWDREQAELIKDVIIHFTGGANIDQLPDDRWRVTSKGYYHFIGA